MRVTFSAVGLEFRVADRPRLEVIGAGEQPALVSGQLGPAPQPPCLFGGGFYGCSV